MTAIAMLFSPWFWLAIAVSVIGAGGGGFAVGMHWKDATYAEARVKADAQAVKDAAKVADTIATIKAKADERVRQADAARQVAENTRHVIYRTITKEIPTYVTAKADAGCIVPNGFVLLHDAAFSGAFPDAIAATTGQGRSNLDAPSGIPLSVVSDVSAANGERCHDVDSKLAACNAYVDTVTTFYNDLQVKIHVCK